MGKSALDEIRARSGDDADGLSCFSVMAKTGLETGRGGARDRATHPSVLLPLVRREHYPGL